MSFLLRRNRPRSIAYWKDTFNRPNESPLQKPWSIWGGIPHDADLVSNTIEFGPANAWVSFGGWSYEHTCFTSSWEASFDMRCSKSGAVAQLFRVIINKPSWSSVNGLNVNDMLAVDIQYRTSLIGCRVMITTYENIGSAGNVRREVGIPQSTFDGSWHSWRIRVNEDNTVAVYLDGSPIIIQTVPSGYGSGLGRRAVNFMSGISEKVWIRDFVLQDQYPVPPSGTSWTPLFYDNFDGRSGNQNGVNGWTQVGNNAAVVSNSWSTTGTTDGSRGLIRNTGISNGYMGVEAVVGGNLGLNNTAGSGLVCHSNSTGTQGLIARVWGDEVNIGRFSSGLNGSPPDFTAQNTLSEDIVDAGDVVGFFCTPNGDCWLEVNGVKKLWAVNMHANVPASNAYAGLQVERVPFNNSHSWNDVRIKTI